MQYDRKTLDKKEARARHMLILERLFKDPRNINKVSVSEIMEMSKKISKQQIYADFEYLSKKMGVLGIEKYRGILKFSERLKFFLKSDFYSRFIDHGSEKRAVAEYIVKKYINNNDSLAIDSGSSTAYVIEEILLQNKKLKFIVTNNTFIYTLAKPIAKVVKLTNGDLDLNNQELRGEESAEDFKKYGVTKCVLSFAGLTTDGSLETWHPGQVEVKQTLLSRIGPEKIIIFLSSYKIGSVAGNEVINVRDLNSSRYVLIIDKPTDFKTKKLIDEFQKYVKIESVNVKK